MQTMWFRRLSSSFLLTGFLVCAVAGSHAQDDTSRRHGRKYKAPPPTSHIEVYVIKKATGKPVVNAAVIFRAFRDGKDDGNLEVKTDPEGKAAIDVITTGSNVQVQVIADGLATFADSYQVDEPARAIHIAMLKPREQVSAYQDNSGQESKRKAGVQEPRPAAAPATGLQSRPKTPDAPVAPAPNAAAPPPPAASAGTTPKP